MEFLHTWGPSSRAQNLKRWGGGSPQVGKLRKVFQRKRGEGKPSSPSPIPGLGGLEIN